MKRCYFSKEHTCENRILIAAHLFNVLLPFGFGLYGVLTNQQDAWLLFGVALCISLILLIPGTLYLIYLYGEYALSSEGITLLYAKKYRLFFPWSSITQICLCTIHKTKGAYKKDHVIWCTVGKIKGGPPNLAPRWNEFEYGFIRFRSVLTMEYTDERLAEFKKYTNREIPDYREMKFVIEEA